MSKISNLPLAVWNDSGQQFQGWLSPNANINDSIVPYPSLSRLQGDAAAGNLLPTGGSYRVGNRFFCWNGYALAEISQKAYNNWPHVNISHAVIRSFLNNQGANLYDQHRQALEIALPPLMTSTAWNKIQELWVPLGANLTGSLVKLKYPSGNSNSFTNNNFVTGDYTVTGGLTGDGSTKYLTSDFNPKIQGFSANNWGMAFHTPSLPVAGSSLNSNSVAGGIFQANGSHYFYGLGQFSNSYCYDNDILNPVWPPNVNYYNGIGGVTPPYGLGRMTWIQGYNNVTSSGVGGLTVQSNLSTVTNVVPNSTMELFGINGENSLFNGTLTGYAIFSGMLNSELDALSRFFDFVNHLAYRPVQDGLLAFGDSIIRGNTLSSYTTQRWTYLLANMLGLVMSNYGMDGFTMSVCPTIGNNGATNTYGAFVLNPASSSNISPEANKTGYLAMPLQGAGGLVVIGLGMNDLSYSGNLSNFISAYQQTITQLQSAGFNNILIAGITYASANGGSAPNGGYYNPALCQQWNAALQNLAYDNNCIYVDMFDLWNASNASTYLYIDGIHPNSTGHQLMAQQAYNAICTARMPIVAQYVPTN